MQASGSVAQGRGGGPTPRVSWILWLAAGLAVSLVACAFIWLGASQMTRARDLLSATFSLPQWSWLGGQLLYGLAGVVVAGFVFLARKGPIGRRVGLLIAGTLFLVGGCSFQAPSIPVGVSPVEGGPPAPAVVPDYLTNAAGQTYGRLRDNVAPEDAPDLIQVRATNGRDGYVLRATLDAITGADVSSPAEAVAWERQQEAAGRGSMFIPVYESDGVTQVGVFEVSRSSPANP